MACADRAVAIVDGSKLGKTAFARICEITEVNEVVTDDSASRERVAAIEGHGTVVKIVPLDGPRPEGEHADPRARPQPRLETPDPGLAPE